MTHHMLRNGVLFKFISIEKNIFGKNSYIDKHLVEYHKHLNFQYSLRYSEKYGKYFFKSKI